MIVKDRSLSTLATAYNSTKAPLTRSQTVPNQYTKNNLDPIPVSVPTPAWSGTGSISSRSSYSSSGSLEHGTPTPIYDPVTLQEFYPSPQHGVIQQNGQSSSDEYVSSQQNGNGELKYYFNDYSH